MIDGDSCNFCGALLDAHCDAGAQHEDPRFCQLKEEYWTTDMTGDQMLDRLFEMTTPDQLQAVDPDVTRRMKAHRYTRDSPSLEPPQITLGPCLPQDSQAHRNGEAAAERWLEGYRYGKGESS